MAYTVYILRSLLNRRHYIGHTKDLPTRLKEHNSGKVRSTKAYRPWEVIYTENYPDKSSAFKREMEIKSYKSGTEFKKLVNK